MWIVCITSVRHVLTVNGYGGRQTKENEKSWCFKGWETLVIFPRAGVSASGKANEKAIGLALVFTALKPTKAGVPIERWEDGEDTTLGG